jgi:hypothetical protein
MSDLTPEEILNHLKKQADTLGIQYHPNIGIEVLKERIATKMAEDKAVTTNTTLSSEDINKLSEEQRIKYIRNQASKLVRVRIACMNPNKKEWEGEIFTVQNDYFTFKKFVPFNVDWHIPQMMLNMIKERKHQIFRDRKDQFGRTITTGHLVPEFTIEELPPLTQEELKDLAIMQAKRANPLGE